MLKITCIVMALIITLAILCSNNVESRAYQNLEGIPASQLHYLGFAKVPINGESGNNDERGEYIHAKRKSEAMQALYMLPYNLVNDHDAK